MANLGGELSVAGTDVWLTPPELLAKLGTFDLDPCAPIDRPWDSALNHYTIENDGLKQEWSGRVWLNPPYGRGMDLWLNKLAEHAGGVLLLYLLEPKLKPSSKLFGAGRTQFFLLKGGFDFIYLQARRRELLARLRFLLPMVKPTKKFYEIALSKASSSISEGVSSEDR